MSAAAKKGAVDYAGEQRQIIGDAGHAGRASRSERRDAVENSGWLQAAGDGVAEQRGIEALRSSNSESMPSDFARRIRRSTGTLEG